MQINTQKELSSAIENLLYSDEAITHMTKAMSNRVSRRKKLRIPDTASMTRVHTARERLQQKLFEKRLARAISKPA